MFVDPLDATREFARGQLECVTVLVGVAVDGKPVAGLIGEPFNKSDPDRVVWGCAGVGVHGLKAEQQAARQLRQATQRQHLPAPAEAEAALFVGAPPTLPELVVAMTHRADRPELQRLCQLLAPSGTLKTGGTGNKLLRLLEGGCDAYTMLKAGTYRWDSCAGEALLRAVGGELTDMHGQPYSYDYGPHTSLANREGIVAAATPELHAHVVAMTAHCSSTADIMRTPDGSPLTLAWLKARLAEADPAALAGLVEASLLDMDAPEATAVRTRHSHVVKVQLRAPHDQWPALLAAGLPRRLLVKRSVARDLAPRSEIKLRRDLISYHTEASFLREFSAPLRASAGLRLARTFYTHDHLDLDSLLSSEFLTISECLEGFEQRPFLSVSCLKAALDQVVLFTLANSSHQNHKTNPRTVRCPQRVLFPPPSPFSKISLGGKAARLLLRGARAHGGGQGVPVGARWILGPGEAAV